MGRTISIFPSRIGRSRAGLKLSIFLLSLFVFAGCQRVDPLAAYAWLYRRVDQPVTARENTLTMIAVGDILLGRGVTNPEQAFAESADWLSSADLTMGNLECALTDHQITATATLSHSMPAPVRLYAPTMSATWLKEAGFDLLGLANNHSLDNGPDGLRETAATLHTARLITIGAGASQEQALQPYIFIKNGVRLAILSVNAIPIPPDNALPPGQKADQGWDIARWDRQAVLLAIETARAEVDAVIVSIHWGYEYHIQPDPAQTQYAELLFAAGADVIIGHHPHVIQSPEVRTLADGRTVLAAYSLGNFIFDQGNVASTDRGLAMRLVFDNSGLRAAQALEVAAGRQPKLIFQPNLDSPATQPTSNAQTTFQCKNLVCTQTLTQQPENFRGGVFETGMADLDGDGELERITLEGGRLRVYEPAGELTWESPARWLVVDAALGDPDWNGRPDLVAIFWKTDQDGILRSHPFLIRQNGGRYEEVWGGSAVSEPIWEVEISDLNNDGYDELVVLAMAPDENGQTLSVWEWHGWGFSQEWRSPPGKYENLRTATGGWLKVDGQ